MAIILARATAADVEPVLRLLERAGLPQDGLADHWATLLVAREDGRLVGTAALEMYADGALLRSVSVEERLRGHGLGQTLTRAALRLARELGAPDVYLLTTTAGGFFPRFGFARIDRDEVPETVRTSIEFRGACPSSAVVMRAPVAAIEAAGGKLG